SHLSAGDRQALVKLIAAAHAIDDVFLKQYWSGNPALYARLQHDTTPLGKARLHYFLLNKGPWSALDENRAFLPGVPQRKLLGANFYPEDMKKEEFEAWVKTLSPSGKEHAQGFFSVIHREGSTLAAVPYSKEYASELGKLAKLLEDAASLTENPTLKKFLTSRAHAFLSNDYYESDLAWMDLDAPLDITIGPYETYNDEIFGYKASFEAYINLRDDEETGKMKFFGNHMQEIENSLPIDAQYKNPKIGALSPIRVVNQVIASGDGAHGVRTAAYNLPNDERVTVQKGTKRVMLRNVQQAKFNSTLVPISKRVLPAAAQADLNFDAFFTHILAHEMTHGIGPHQITVAGRKTTPRQELKELYSAIEEAKADVCGLFMLQYMYDHKLLPSAERKLYTSFLASSFRTLRFGLHEAHGKGMAVQFNYLMDKGAFVANADGTFAVDFSKVKDGVRDLAHDLLTIEATGDYAGAGRMLDSLGHLRPVMTAALSKLTDIPTDIDPVNVTADKLSPAK
ncbi:MAG: MutT/NUDIX family protein, partial [Bryobacterales bacterium]|nr:MutT/NUDIX family protein [Bryobacterales bacterium]